MGSGRAPSGQALAVPAEPVARLGPSGFDPSRIADKLDEARALIEKGWCQGSYRNGASFCAWGALNKAVTGDPENDWSRATEPHERLLCSVIDAGHVSGIGPWNDAPERTQPEVIEAFRKAAELARASNPTPPSDGDEK